MRQHAAEQPLPRQREVLWQHEWDSVALNLQVGGRGWNTGASDERGSLHGARQCTARTVEPILLATRHNFSAVDHNLDRDFARVAERWRAALDSRSVLACVCRHLNHLLDGFAVRIVLTVVRRVAWGKRGLLLSFRVGFVNGSSWTSEPNLHTSDLPGRVIAAIARRQRSEPPSEQPGRCKNPRLTRSAPTLNPGTSLHAHTYRNREPPCSGPLTGRMLSKAAPEGTLCQWKACTTQPRQHCIGRALTSNGKGRVGAARNCRHDPRFQLLHHAWVANWHGNCSHHVAVGNVDDHSFVAKPSVARATPRVQVPLSCVQQHSVRQPHCHTSVAHQRGAPVIAAEWLWPAAMRTARKSDVGNDHSGSGSLKLRELFTAFGKASLKQVRVQPDSAHQ